MTESRPTSRPEPEPRDLYWSMSFLRDGLQEVKLDLREFRKEVAQQFAEFRKEAAEQFATERKAREEQLAEHRRETRQDLRHNLMAMIGVVGTFAVIIIAFIQYRLPGG